jgi:hypothetical protein
MLPPIVRKIADYTRESALRGEHLLPPAFIGMRPTILMPKT